MLTINGEIRNDKKNLKEINDDFKRKSLLIDAKVEKKEEKKKEKRRKRTEKKLKKRRKKKKKKLKKRRKKKKRKKKKFKIRIKIISLRSFMIQSTIGFISTIMIPKINSILIKTMLMSN
ncbi:hypothetical protein HZH66_012668 [Vespula vulgaris]|uniref:Uncharacterized protein n=1 Tax=Vespula vulgaris TaxID=7454 RepID=A0A834J9H2_VESVU|nr:hypothetical protein HZH66_012668 [Vespula vulgaris]